ncbi:unnamed protein product [Urochloa humidicola]
MASPELRRDPRRLETLADELLEEIFLRVPEAADLARASATCPNFRRVIADHSFLRRFRALHPPPLLGILSEGFIPAQPPHSSAAAARAFADAADFACSFLPSRNRWHRCDFRDGRALLIAVPESSNSSTPGDSDQRSLVRELAVCDPVHRRYLLLPAIPDDLAALALHPDTVKFEPFLAPANEDERGTLFRVICMVKCQSNLVIFIYSSSSGQWHAATSDCPIALIAENGNHSPCFNSELSGRYYAHGCFCWASRYMDKLLVLDTHSMEFSDVNSPHSPLTDQSSIINRAIIEAGEGRLGMLTLCSHLEYGLHFWYTVLQSDGQSGNKWHSKAIIQLPFVFCNIMGVAGGFLLLQGISQGLPSTETLKLDCFSLNLKTFELEWFYGTKYVILGAQLYAGLPLSLCAPTI